jgi:hypothetical protein
MVPFWCTQNYILVFEGRVYQHDRYWQGCSVLLHKQFFELFLQNIKDKLNEIERVNQKSLSWKLW